jgi:hypothetical protein
VLIVIFFVLLSSCSVFLGPDPDNNPKGIFNSIWNDFDNTYALFDIKGIEWKPVYDKYVTKISSGMSDKELFAVCSGMLGELDDAHVGLASSFGFFNSGGRLGSAVMEPFSLELVKSEYLNSGYSTAGDGIFTYGTFKSKPSLGYIFLSGFVHGKNTG